MTRTLLALAAFLPVLGACDDPAAPAATAGACEAVSFEGSNFTVCAARPGKQELRLVDLGKDGQALREFDRVATHLDKDRERVVFAMNAGMFDDSGRPIGLHIEKGRELKPLNRRDGPGNFHMKPNGVFFGDLRGWHILTTEGFAERRLGNLDFATQSGPMLVIAGALHPKISADGVSLQLRNGVGVDAGGTAWFAISDDPVSFGRFARLFRDRLKCDNALYLDGAVSRLWDPRTGRIDAGPPLGPIVVALETP